MNISKVFVEHRNILQVKCTAFSKITGFCGIKISEAGVLTPQEAGNYFIKVAEKGHTLGLLFAGMGYVEGEYGIKQDYQMARKYFFCKHLNREIQVLCVI